jgi:hypothetical protein
MRTASPGTTASAVSDRQGAKQAVGERPCGPWVPFPLGRQHRGNTMATEIDALGCNRMFTGVAPIQPKFKRFLGSR